MQRSRQFDGGFRKLLREESGATAVESAVILAVIVSACVIGIATISQGQAALWQRTIEAVDIRPAELISTPATEAKTQGSNAAPARSTRTERR